MKQGLTLFLLALLATNVSASSLGDSMLKGVLSGPKSPASNSQSSQPVESYYGGKDLANIVIA